MYPWGVNENQLGKGLFHHPENSVPVVWGFFEVMDIF